MQVHPTIIKLNMYRIFGVRLMCAHRIYIHGAGKDGGVDTPRGEPVYAAQNKSASEHMHFSAGVQLERTTTSASAFAIHLSDGALTRA